MKDTENFKEYYRRHLLAKQYHEISENRIIERRLALLQGFVTGMVVMAVLILCVGAYCWRA